VVATLTRRLLLAALVAAALALAFFTGRWLTAPDRLEPDELARTGLETLRVQNRLSVLRASFVTVQTRREEAAFGLLTAERTLLLPGAVAYEVDLARLRDGDVRWDEATRTMTVTAPPVEVVGPEVDVQRMKSFQSGRFAELIGGAEARLDQVTRTAALADLRGQAAAPAMIVMAQDAARRAIAANFALPLRAAGLDARVTVRFRGDPVPNDDRVDTTRSLREVLGNTR
jgi:hypothetical protein